MEHELFQSKLKPSVDGASILDILRSSSSGQNSHRTAAMELVLEKSIQERRERISAKAKNSLRPDPTPQPKETNEARNNPSPGVQSTTPASAPQPSLFLRLSTIGNASKRESASANCEASQVSSKPVTKTKVVRREDLPVDTTTSLPPSEEFVRLECRSCGDKERRSRLQFGIYCSSCLGLSGIMKCGGCGTLRVENVVACSNCRRKFK